MIDVRDHGVPLDGSDATAPFQVMLDAAPTGETISIPPGKVGITSVSIAKPLRLQGASYAGSFIVPLADTDCLRVNVGGASKLYSPTISDLAFSPAVDRQAGALIRLGNVGKATLANLKLDAALKGKPYEGIRCDAVSQTGFSNIHLSSCRSNGVVIQNSGGTCVDLVWDALCEITSCLFWGMKLVSSDPTGATDVEGLQLHGMRFGANGLGALLLDSPAGVIRNIHCHGVAFDSSGEHGVVASGANRIENLVFANCWSSNNITGHGYLFEANVMDAAISGGNVQLNGGHGVFIDGAQRVTVSGVECWNNGQHAPSYGICVEGAAKGIGLISNHVYNATKNNYRKQLGVSIDPAAECHEFGTWGAL
jgi:hypothetical protein